MVHSSWSDLEIKQLIDLYPKSTKEELLIAFPNRTWIAIKTRAIKLGLILSRRNNVGDLSILLNESPISLYWIGFLCADGHFTENTLQLELSDVDIDHLTNFGLYINYSVDTLYHRTRTLNNKKYKMSTLTIGHKEVITQLRSNYNICNKKTTNPVNLDKLSDLQQLCFFIGFIDGDGSICVRTDKSIILSIEIDESWLSILKQFQCLLSKLDINTTANAVLYTRKDTLQTFARWQTSSKVSIKKLKLFAIKQNLPILNRKWDKL